MTPDAIDISDNNSGVDIHAIAASGVHLIVSKCSEGTGGQHPGFAQHWQACATEIAAGHLTRRASYHFALADASPQANAAAAHTATGTLSGDDFIALDCEAPNPTTPWAQAAGTPSIEWVLACLHELERLSKKRAWLYCSLGFLQGVLHSDPRLSAFPLWIADINPIASVPTPWPYALWQYSWTGTVPGVNGHVDCSRFGPAYQSTLSPSSPGSDIVLDADTVQQIRDIVNQCLEAKMGGGSMVPPDPHATLVDVMKHYLPQAK